LEKHSERLYVWASDIEPDTLHQAHETAKLPIIDGHVALMPDAHIGKGATIGSVIPTISAIIPSAVGVDIGCGMIATKTSLKLSNLPDNLDIFLKAIESAVPAGLGKWHSDVSRQADNWMRNNVNPRLDSKQEKKASVQFGTLGSGNHFFEICHDENEDVWVVMHSGSRGVGNELAVGHIRMAKAIAKMEGYAPEDPELAWLQENTPEFEAYILDMLWAQKYAMANRQQMMDAAISSIFSLVVGRVEKTINCHHNFAHKEIHNGKELWITRKGAIKADVGDEGVIPGSMGGKSYIVRGLGNPLSYNSCSHGAGRKMSRTRARKELSLESFAERMGGATWQADMAKELLDEHPDSYKNIEQVMADQLDLVEIVHELRAIVNYKGTS
jgi:tRNA-splicing ligase RtcB